MDKINIAGKERVVRYNFNAYEELDEMGFDILNGVGKLSSVKFVRAIAFVGLKYGEDETGVKEPELSIKQVGASLKNEHIKQFFDILNKQASTDEPEKPGESVGLPSSV